MGAADPSETYPKRAGAPPRCATQIHPQRRTPCFRSKVAALRHFRGTARRMPLAGRQLFQLSTGTSCSGGDLPFDAPSKLHCCRAGNAYFQAKTRHSQANRELQECRNYGRSHFCIRTPPTGQAGHRNYLSIIYLRNNPQNYSVYYDKV